MQRFFFDWGCLSVSGINLNNFYSVRNFLNKFFQQTEMGNKIQVNHDWINWIMMIERRAVGVTYADKRPGEGCEVY